MRSCPDDGSSFSNAALNFACSTIGVPRVNTGFPLPFVKELETILEHSVYLTTTLASTSILTTYLLLSVLMSMFQTRIFCCIWKNSYPPHGATIPQLATASSLSRFHDHTQTHHTRYDSSVRVIISLQWPLPDNTRQSQDTPILPGGIRTRNSRK